MINLTYKGNKIQKDGLSISIKKGNTGFIYIWGQGYTNNIITTSTSEPQLIDIGVVFEQVDNGQNFSIGLDKKGSMWGWGNNNLGQLGLGDTVPRSTPTQIGNDTDWVEVECSSFGAMAIKENGTLWGWGSTSSMNGLTGTTLSPIQIGTDTDWLTTAISTQYPRLLLKTNGTLWGMGPERLLGINSSSTNQQILPVQIGSDTDWVKIGTADSVGFGIKSNGTLWSFGSDYEGLTAQGVNNGSTYTLVPTQVGTDTWSFISTGNFTMFAINTSGFLYGWGRNRSASNSSNTTYLIDNTTTTRSEPTQVRTKSDWVSYAFNYSSEMVALDSVGKIYSWGRDWSWTGASNNQLQYREPVELIFSENINNIYAGLQSSFATF